VNLAKAAPAPVSDQRNAPIASGRIIVKFKDTASLNAMSKTLGALEDAAVNKTIPAIDALVLSVPAGSEWAMIDQLRAQSAVEYAEPDYRLSLIR
jgi:hypothetical protein